MSRTAVRLDRDALDRLVAILRERGYEIYAPVKDGTEGGWKAIRAMEQLELNGPPPQSPKRFFHQPQSRLVSIEKENGSFRVLPEPAPQAKIAVLGIRPCDLAALTRLDRVLVGDRFRDTHYEVRRKNSFVVVCNCIEAADTCFCVSMETGPAATAGFDIAMTPEAGGEDYLAEAGSESGTEILRACSAVKAEAAWAAKIKKGVERAKQQTRSVDWRKAPATLDAQRENPRWQETAKRCMACGNCTMSCPTCFCVNTGETSSLDLTRAERWRVWDSCFNLNFTYIHGGPVRMSRHARYRHWLTHKFARWVDQFGETGCTGCGRCIQWCPAGIDHCEELVSLNNSSN